MGNINQKIKKSMVIFLENFDTMHSTKDIHKYLDGLW
jgi:hypothetical protein